MVNALLRAMGISAHLRSTEDVQHACSRCPSTRGKLPALARAGRRLVISNRADKRREPRTDASAPQRGFLSFHRRTSLFVALCEAVLGVPVPQAVRETRSCLDIQQNIQAVLDQASRAGRRPPGHLEFLLPPSQPPLDCIRSSVGSSGLPCRTFRLKRSSSAAPSATSTCSSASFTAHTAGGAAGARSAEQSCS